MIKSVLVTGVNSFVGQSLFHELCNSGYEVYGTVRSKNCSEKESISEEVYKLDNYFDANWKQILNGIDCVIHLASINDSGKERNYQEIHKFNVLFTEFLIKKSVELKVKKFIFVSSIKVNGEFSILNQAFNNSSHPSPKTYYAKSKFEAENRIKDVCKSSQTSFTIIRPPLIYGPGVKGNFLLFLKLASKRIPLPIERLHNKRSMLFIENFNDFIKELLVNSNSANKTFFISDGEDISTKKLLLEISYNLNIKMKIFPFPVSLIRSFFYLIGLSSISIKLFENLQIDNSESFTQLNWIPPYSIYQGIKITTEWYRND